MLLSDRDIRAELTAGRIGLEPLDLGMVQPSSIDVRLDRFFRLFDNHKYPFIDPAEDQPDLTHLLEVEPDQPFILHPGEFVLGSTFELVTLPDDIAARLAGRVFEELLTSPPGTTTHAALTAIRERLDDTGWRRSQLRQYLERQLDSDLTEEAL